MRPLHILHVLNSAHGGSAISTFELIDALRMAGIQSSLVCFDNANKEQQKKIELLVDGRVMFIPLYWMNKRVRSAWWKRPLIELRSLVATWGGHKYQRKIDEMIAKNGINIVHTSTILNPEGAFAATRNKLPHVWHVRELIGPTKHFKFYNYKRWSEFVDSHCDCLVANSGVTRDCLLQFFKEEKIICIPNGIDVGGFEAKTHSNSNGQLTIGMIGSVTTRWKNHAHFIHVAAAFKNRTDIRFVIYGALPHSNDAYYTGLRALVSQLGLGATLHFEPFKKPGEIMREMDIMFHPAGFESFGRIFAEAMAAGIPIVAVNEGAAPELVRHNENGLVVKLESVDEATTAINLLAGSVDLRNKFGQRGRALVEEHYSIETLRQRMTALYRRLQKN